MQQTLRSITALTLALLPTIALADKKLEEVTKPDVKAPVTAWSPAQHFRAAQDSNYGNGTNMVGVLLLADELGGKLSELGRAATIQRCLHHPASVEEGVLAWAVCRHDVKAIDLAKLEAELKAEGIVGKELTSAIDWVKDIIKTARLTGDPIEKLAASEPGIAQILKVADDARAEWTAYEAKNQAVVDRYRALKDGVRSARSNDKAFTGCFEATQPAFAKIMKAAAPKIPYEINNPDAIEGYTGAYLPYLPVTVDTYVATVSYAACLWSLHETAAHFYGVAANQANGRAIAGPRTLAAARLFDPAFKPTFGDRSLSFQRPREWKDGAQLAAARQIDDAYVNAEGNLGTITPAGQLTKVRFRGRAYDECVQRSKNVDQTCLKTVKQYDATVGEGNVFTKFFVGAKPDFGAAIKFGFPEVIWNPKTKKLTTILTIQVN